jgi:GMP reductase
MEIFDYDNILLLPRKCRVESRSECDTSVELGGRCFRLPVVPANMKTVVDEKICTWLAQNGYRHGQGYLFSRPMSVAATAHYLAEFH